MDFKELFEEISQAQKLTKQDLICFEEKASATRACVSVMDEILKDVQPFLEAEYKDVSEEFKEDVNAKITALTERLNNLDTTDGDELARLNYIIGRHGEERHSHEATSTQLVVRISELEEELRRKDQMYINLQQTSTEQIKSLEMLKTELYKQTKLLTKEIQDRNEQMQKQESETDKLLKLVAEKQFKMDKEKFDADLKAKEDELKSLRKEYKNKESQLKTTFQSYNATKTSLEEFESKESSWEEERRSLSKMKNEYQSKFEMEEAKNAQLQSEVEQLTEQNKLLHESTIQNEMKMQSQMSDYQSVVDTTKELKEKVAEYHQEIQQFKKEKKVLVREIQKLRAESQSKDETIDALHQEKDKMKTRHKSKIEEIKLRNAEVKTKYETMFSDVDARLNKVHHDVDARNEILRNASLEMLIRNSPDLAHQERLVQANNFLDGVLPDLNHHLNQDSGDVTGLFMSIETLRRFCLRLLKDKAIYSKKLNNLRAVGVYSVAFSEVPLGFTPVPTDDQQNLIVESVESESSADFQGVLPGSIIVSIGSTNIENKGSFVGTQTFAMALTSLPIEFSFRPL